MLNYLLKTINRKTKFLYQSKFGGKRIFHPEYCDKNPEKLLLTKFISLGELIGVIDYGCGDSPWKDLSPEKWIGVDIQEGANVDFLITDSFLPPDVPAFSHFICRSVLEHVDDQEKFMREFEKEIPEGTYCYFLVPFLVHEHGYPHDYVRYTIEGLRSLFKEHDEIFTFKLGGTGYCFSRIICLEIYNLLIRNRTSKTILLLGLPVWMIVFSFINFFGWYYDRVFSKRKDENLWFYNSSVICFRKK